MSSKNLPNKLLIIGPCAVETREQVMETIIQSKKLGVDFVRLSLWKPRTKPGFEGIGEKGIKLLVEGAKMGVNPAVEPIIPEHAKMAVDSVMKATANGKLLLWIGARNQNHYIQREIARIASKNDRVILMVKNQIWRNEKHWEGIIDHVLKGGIKKSNIIICHRGFDAWSSNPHGYRNIPDYDMAMRMKDRTGLPMVFDPSHTGGSVEKVMRIAEEAADYDFDGLIVEVHPNPKKALTDAIQQLTWEEFKKLLDNLYKKRLKKAKKSQGEIQ